MSLTGMKPPVARGRGARHDGEDPDGCARASSRRTHSRASGCGCSGSTASPRSSNERKGSTMSPTKQKQGSSAAEGRRPRRMRARAKDAEDGPGEAVHPRSARQDGGRPIAQLGEADRRDRGGRSLPSSSRRRWYGMPAYVNSDGKAVCLLPRLRQVQVAVLGTCGFNDSAKLDGGAMWPIVYAPTTKLSEGRRGQDRRSQSSRP